MDRWSPSLRIARQSLAILALCSLLAIFVYQHFVRDDELPLGAGGAAAAAELRTPAAQELVRTCDPRRTKLLVCVFSRPGNVANRQAIRDTWGRALRNATADVFFLVGHSRSETLMPLLREEMSTFDDIMLGNFTDSYYNLTLKSVTMARFAASYCPSVDFVMKTDDDVLINTAKLLADLGHLERRSRTIWGYLAKDWKPKRSAESKWFVPAYIFGEDTFPDFVTGPGYLMSGDVPRLLYEGSANVRYLHLEDVFLTGIVAAKVNVARVSHEGFANTRVFLRACDTTDAPWFMSHGYSPAYMRVAWDSLQRRLAMCPRAKGRLAVPSAASASTSSSASLGAAVTGPTSRTRGWPQNVKFLEGVLATRREVAKIKTTSES